MGKIYFNKKRRKDIEKCDADIKVNLRCARHLFIHDSRILQYTMQNSAEVCSNSPRCVIVLYFDSRFKFKKHENRYFL